ncbi:YBR259W [Zygosaccharomyces parabailii]|nr:YBR259W [Zygosaccharomyces parabailii]CDH11347.1 uncharacterized protein ZBAI_03133 [Zygosaccharomyces bailii ISA1307]
MDASEVFGEYDRLLSYYLGSTSRIQCRTAQKMDHLMHYARQRHLGGANNYFYKKLKHGFERLAIRLLAEKNSFENSWQGLVIQQCIYKSKVQSLKQHILNLDKKGRLWKKLKHYLIRTVYDQLPSIFSQVCSYYIFTSRDCEFELIQIYKSVCDYEMEVRFNEDAQMAAQRGVLSQREDAIWFSIKRWIVGMDNDFCKVYCVWKNYIDLLELIGCKNTKSCGMQMFFGDDSHLLLKSLNNVVLTPNLIGTVYNYNGNIKWKKEFLQGFIKVRDTTWKQDFNQILVVIFSSDHFGASCGDAFANSLRKKFQQSIGDVNKLYSGLLNYLDTVFQENYRKLRRVPSSLCSNSDLYWVTSLVTFVSQYVPYSQEFIRIYLRKGVFRQMVMLGSKFPAFYKHDACLERIFIEGMSEVIPRDVHCMLATIESALLSLADSEQICHGRTAVDKIFLSSESAEELSLNSITPIWPSSSFEEYWNQEVESFSRQGKVLHGAFKNHMVTMKLPLNHLRKTITLITTLSMASIIYLYNDFERIPIEKMRLKLCIDEERESLFLDCLQKLLDQRLLLKISDEIYTFNYKFMPDSDSLNKGFIKVT